MAKNFTIPSKYENVTQISDIINKYMTDRNIEKKIADEFEICLLEALNNIIKHSYQNNPNNEIDIMVEIREDRIIVELSDKGLTRKNIGKATLEFDPDDIEKLPEGGMGLFIIENLMDETYYSTKDSINTYKIVKICNKKNH